MSSGNTDVVVSGSKGRKTDATTMPKPPEETPPTDYWREKLIKYFENNEELSMHGESKKAGFSASWVRDILIRKHEPSVAKLLHLCESMKIEPSILFDSSTDVEDLQSASVDKWLGINEIPIRAIVSKEDNMVQPLSPMMQKALGKIVVSIDKTRDYTVLIDSEAFKPALFPGDVAVFTPIRLEDYKSIDRFIDRMCLIRTGDRRHMIRILSRDNGDGTFQFSNVDRSSRDLINARPMKISFLRHKYTDLIG